MKEKIPVITIDGPSGSGKGTVGQIIAKKLGWHFLDSGALYRVLALYALQQRMDLQDEAKLAELARDLPVHFELNESNGAPKVLLNNQDISEDIRTSEVSEAASKVAPYKKVREALLACQRDFLKPPGVIADGRDMGTVIFPQAALKIFMTASVEERARRRMQQLQGSGRNVSLAQLLKEQQQRDERDSQRSVAPLKPASDAMIIDTTLLSINDVVEKIMQEVKKLN